MNLRVFRTGGLLACLLSPLAQASSDYECAPSWRLVERNLNACSNLAFLSPGNDSRVNLQLLLADAGRLTLPSPLPAAEGFAQVPFSLDMLRRETATADDDEIRALRRENFSLELAEDGLAEGPLPEEQAWAEGEGSRCRSNGYDSSRLFIRALADSPLSAQSRSLLAGARLRLLAQCEGSEPLALPEPLDSPLADDFLRYLQGADAFYRGDLAAAAAHFTRLLESPQPWLQETAHYLQGRVALNQAQSSAFDEDGYFDLEQADAAALARARQAFEQYLGRYPDAAYAASAEGLLRRVYWLEQDTAAQAAALAARLHGPALEASDMQQLLDELDDKLLPQLAIGQLRDPSLLAMLDLMQLRDPGSDQPPLLTLEQLDAQRGHFAAQPELFTYLQAAWHFYRAADAGRVLQLLPADESPGALGWLAFSRQMLRGLALEQTAADQALAHWLHLLVRPLDALQREQVALAWAFNRTGHGQTDALFAGDSPLQSVPARLRVLRHLASAERLREQVRQPASADEQAVALDSLLGKSLLFGRHADFVADQALLAQLPAAQQQRPELARYGWGGQREGYQCPALVEIARRLEQRADDAQAGLCLGEFIRQHSFDGVDLNRQPAADELGGAASAFSGQTFSRLGFYQALLENPQASDADKAYALFRAIRCFAPSGYNGCDDQDIAEAQRKRWFQTLKGRYGKSPWAAQLQYYW